MGTHITKGILLDLDSLGVGVIIDIKSSREPVLQNQLHHPDQNPFLLKASYVLDVLVEEKLHSINLSVHWYHPAGSPQGWWSHEILSRSPTPSWHAVKWL
jgi:hypothetical protein